MTLLFAVCDANLEVGESSNSERSTEKEISIGYKGRGLPLLCTIRKKLCSHENNRQIYPHSVVALSGPK